MNEKTLSSMLNRKLSPEARIRIFQDFDIVSDAMKSVERDVNEKLGGKGNFSVNFNRDYESGFDKYRVAKIDIQPETGNSKADELNRVSVAYNPDNEETRDNGPLTFIGMNGLNGPAFELARKVVSAVYKRVNDSYSVPDFNDVKKMMYKVASDKDVLNRDLINMSGISGINRINVNIHTESDVAANGLTGEKRDIYKIDILPIVGRNHVNYCSKSSVIFDPYNPVTELSGSRFFNSPSGLKEADSLMRSISKDVDEGYRTLVDELNS